MILYIIIIVLSLLVVFFGFSTFNLMRKQEKAEDVLVSYMEYLDRLSRAIEISDKTLKELDTDIQLQKNNKKAESYPNQIFDWLGGQVLLDNCRVINFTNRVQFHVYEKTK